LNKKVLHFFIGTKAQLIKMAPLMQELARREVPFRYVDSGQHAGITSKLRADLSLPEPCITLRSTNSDITSITTAAIWYLKLVATTWFGRRWLRREVFPGGGICLIHGDTLSTLLGMQLARAAGLSVAHVEAGLRSWRIWNPFPEELIRICCMLRADVLFTPSDEATKNLTAMKVRGKVIRAEGNTVVDSLRIVAAAKTPGVDLPTVPFVLATCHRMETITRRKRLAAVIEAINQIAESIHVEFVVHGPTQTYLQRFGLNEKLHENVFRRDMMEYARFIWLLRNARGVASDGGSIQEECGYLKMPCLILRQATERSDGLGATAILWGDSTENVDQFLSQLRVTSHPASVAPDQSSPSKVIVDSLLEYLRVDS
jgi:UDP-N-acetylglucosamine 2-epimerase (non-hydrolysing)